MAKRAGRLARGRPRSHGVRPKAGRRTILCRLVEDFMSKGLLLHSEAQSQVSPVRQWIGFKPPHSPGLPYPAASTVTPTTCPASSPSSSITVQA